MSGYMFDLAFLANPGSTIGRDQEATLDIIDVQQMALQEEIGKVTDVQSVDDYNRQLNRIETITDNVDEPLTDAAAQQEYLTRQEIQHYKANPEQYLLDYSSNPARTQELFDEYHETQSIELIVPPVPPVQQTPVQYIPQPLLRLNPHFIRTPKERLEFFIKNGRYYTNSDITESRDHITSDEFVYPVFRLGNDWSKYNPLRFVYDTANNPRYDKYFPLNKYKVRLAAQINPDKYGKSINPDEWYDFAAYVVPADFSGDMTFPTVPIDNDEFEKNIQGANTVAASFSDYLSNDLGLGSVLTWVLIVGGVVLGIIVLGELILVAKIVK